MPVLLLSVVALLAAVFRMEPPRDTRPADVLVRELLDESTRGAAYYELSARASPGEWRSARSFAEGHRHPEVVLCPQGEGLAPLILVLSRFLPQHGREAPPAPAPRDASGVLRLRSRLLVDVLTAAGESVAPFGGNNVLDEGYVGDVNGHGFVERVSRTSYGVDGVEEVQVLEVTRVRTVAEPLLSVLYNWGKRREWGYRLVERDGLVEVELGPRTASGLLAKATYRWSAAEGRYVGPEGSGAEHVVRLRSRDVGKELERLRAERLTFPMDPDHEEDAPLHGDAETARIASLVAEARAWEPGSLAGRSDEELLRYMGEGRSAFELELAAIVSDRLPDRFWELPAPDAALALAEANRAERHRCAYELSVSPPDGSKELEAGSIRLESSSPPCYVRSRGVLRLEVDPRGAYLASAVTSRAGTVFLHAVVDPELHELRFLEVPYADARQVLNVVRRLKDVRSDELDQGHDGAFMSFSTSDGRGALEVRGADGKELLRVRGRLWGSTADRWNEHVDDDVVLNLASFLLERALPERLGEASATGARDRSEALLGGAALEPGERRTLSAAAGKLLDRFSRGERGLPFELVESAVRAAGENGLVEHEGRIEAIRRSLGPFALSPRAIGMRVASDAALRQMRATRDPAALEAWARSEGRGGAWALRQLLRLEPARAVEPLLRRLDRREGKEARQVFATLALVAPERAREVARGPRRGDLGVAALALSLPHAGAVRELVNAALSEGTSWEERVEAIRILVPAEEPMRHPQPEIDEALTRLLRTPSTDELVAGPAARAVAWREGASSFETLRERLASSGPHEFHAVLSALARLASRRPSGGGRAERAALAGIVGSHLRETDRMLNELLWTAFASDLRELEPDLARVATASPEDVEGGRARSYGGGSRPVSERYHLARKVLAIWTEPDDLTRAKLLLALGFGEDFYPMGFGEETERVERLAACLRETVSRLTEEEREAALVFLWLCETKSASSKGGARRSLPERADPRRVARALGAT